MGLSGDRRRKILGGRTDGHTGSGITNLFQVFEVAVSMTGLTFGGGTEHGSHVVVALDVSLGGKVEITAIGLGLTREGVLEILFGLAAFQ
jgi:hypothetical protein